MRLKDEAGRPTLNQHHDDHHGWVTDAERWICQLQGVRQSKIDLDANGDVAGIHVVASADRDPRLVVRDVEGLLKARLGLDVYYKKIGVVQVLDQDEPVEAETPAAPDPEPDTVPEAEEMPEAEIPDPVPFPFADDLESAVLLEEATPSRVECAGVGLLASGATLTGSVELVRGGASAQGRATGPNHPGTDVTILARAAVQALEKLLDEPVTLSVADVRQQEAAGEPVLVVAVDLVEGRRSERYFGLCRTHPNSQQAAVYAVLDALNRRLELMGSRLDEAVLDG